MLAISFFGGGSLVAHNAVSPEAIETSTGVNTSQRIILQGESADQTAISVDGFLRVLR